MTPDSMLTHHDSEINLKFPRKKSKSIEDSAHGQLPEQQHSSMPKKGLISSLIH